jgi:uncharacterized protein DUF1840
VVIVLVRFRSEAGDITTFGDVGVALLKMMGQSGVLPGALLARDIPAALERLKRAAVVAPVPPDSGAKADGGEEPTVSLKQRAFPLIELLERCVKKNCDLIWEEERPLVPPKAPR